MRVFNGLIGKRERAGMKIRGNRRKRHKRTLSLHYLLALMMLISVLISTTQSSFGIDVLQAGRGINAVIAANDSAFVGIMHDDVYKVVYSEEKSNNFISMHVKNNMPEQATFSISLSGQTVKDYLPGSFTLSPGEVQFIEIQLLDLEEAFEKSIEGISDILGIVSAQSGQGSVNAQFSFAVEVDLPEKKETREELQEGENKEEAAEKNAMEKAAGKDATEKDGPKLDAPGKDMSEKQAIEKNVMKVDTTEKKTTENDDNEKGTITEDLNKKEVSAENASGKKVVQENSVREDGGNEKTKEADAEGTDT